MGIGISAPTPTQASAAFRQILDEVGTLREEVLRLQGEVGEDKEEQPSGDGSAGSAEDGKMDAPPAPEACVGGGDGSAGGAEDGKMDAPPAPEACVGGIDDLLAPGTLYRGDILIPGIGEIEAAQRDAMEDGRERYFLECLEAEEEEEGLSADSGGGLRAWFVSHTAYGDTQTCTLTVTASGGGGGGGGSGDATGTHSGPGAVLAAAAAAAAAKPPGDDPTARREHTVSYRDGETVCTGKLETSGTTACEIRGGVAQLIQGEEGFMYPSKTKTHVFRLRRVDEPPARRAARSQLRDAQFRLAELLGRLGSAIQAGPNPLQGPHIEGAEGLPDEAWEQAVEALDRSGQDTCARLRRHAQCLGEMVFTSEEDRTRRLEGAKGRGCSRAKAHALSDRVMGSLTGLMIALLRMCADLEGVEGTVRRMKFYNELARVHYVTRMRLQAAFALFDVALRAAERRVTQDTIDAWVVEEEEEEEGGGGGGGRMKDTLCVSIHG